MKSVAAVFGLCIVSIWAVPLAKPVSLQRHPGGRIVGGDVAKTGQFPWEVAIYLDTSDGTYFCGGALIDLHWVLTAGHCVYHATVFTLHLGANSLVDDDVNRLTLPATHSEVHPNYDPNGLDYDIGLIRIDSDITTNEFIQLVPIAASPLGSNVAVVVSGWGATGDWDGAVNDLNYVGLTTISNADCKTVYGEAAITDGMVCAVGSTNEGTCSGDSGSPLVLELTPGNAIHVGIVSWISESGCETDHPTGYTRTAYYVDWIESVIS